MLAKDIRDHAEVPDERFRAFELLYVRDELADLHSIDDVLAGRLTPPCVKARDG